jgi:aminoglycoside 3-N-acetyltransferase
VSDRSHVTVTDIVAGLRALGLGAGDTVFVHAAMGRLGYVEGGAAAVVEAFREAVGPEGTLAMPGFSFQLGEQTAPVFDVRNTPCWASKLYELFRIQPGVSRSHHVTHSVCATGARAGELTAEHSLTPCGAESPFLKFAAWDAKIVLVGVSHNSSTTFHAVEERARLWYVGYKDLPGATIVDEHGAHRPIGSRIHDMARPYDFNRVNDLLEREGIQRQAVIGDAIVRCLDASRLVAALTELVRHDPDALLREGKREIEIPVSVR